MGAVNPSKPGLLIKDNSRHSPVLATPPPLLMGMYITATIEGVYLDSFAIVPRVAIREGDVLWTLDEENRLKFVPLTIVQENDDQVTVISEELKDGTSYVISKLSVVTEGMKVNAILSEKKSTIDHSLISNVVQ